MRPRERHYTDVRCRWGGLKCACDGPTPPMHVWCPMGCCFVVIVGVEGWVCVVWCAPEYLCKVFWWDVYGYEVNVVCSETFKWCPHAPYACSMSHGVIHGCGCGCEGLVVCGLVWAGICIYTFIRCSGELHMGMRCVWYALRCAIDAPMSPMHVAPHMPTMSSAFCIICVLMAWNCCVLFDLGQYWVQIGGSIQLQNSEIIWF